MSYNVVNETILREIMDKDIVYIQNQMEYIKITDITLERYMFHVFQSHLSYYKENREQIMFFTNFPLFPPEEVKFSVMMYGYLVHIIVGDIKFTDKEIEETWNILWKGLKI